MKLWLILQARNAAPTTFLAFTSCSDTVSSGPLRASKSSLSLYISSSPVVSSARYRGENLDDSPPKTDTCSAASQRFLANDFFVQRSAWYLFLCGTMPEHSSVLQVAQDIVAHSEKLVSPLYGGV